MFLWDQNQTQAKIENHAQGQCDQIFPWENAAEIHLNWPASTFLLVPNAGHASSEPGILEALMEATEAFKTKTLKIIEE